MHHAPMTVGHVKVRILCWSLVAAVSFVFMNAGIREGSSRIDANLLNFWANLLWLPIYLVTHSFSSARSVPLRHAPRASLIALVCGSIANGAAIVLLCFGLQLLPISTVTFISASKNIFVLILSILLTKEHGSPRLWTASGLGLFGVWMIVQPGDGGFDWIAALLVLMSAACAALAIVQVGQSFRGYSFALVLIFLTFGEIAVSLPFIFSQIADIDATHMLYAFGIGGAAVVAAFASAKVVRLVQFPAFALLQFLRLPASALLGYLLFGEHLSLWSWIGGLLIFGAIWFAYRGPNSGLLLQRPSAAG